MKNNKSVRMVFWRMAVVAMVVALSGCSYEDKLSRDFWYYLVNNDVESFREWYDETSSYMLLNPATPNASHFYKKLGMANIMFSSINGGSNDFHWSSSPYILQTLKYATLAHETAEENDGFAERMALTYNKLVMSVFLNDGPGVYDAIAAIEEAANDPALAPFQKPVYYEVMGTLLLTAHDPALVRIGLDALEFSIELTNDCFTQDCNDARTLAPFYNVMNHLAAGEGAAMIGDYQKSAEHLAEAERLAVDGQWPYLAELRAYIPEVPGKFVTATQVTSPIPNGFKAEQPFLFNHTNGCHYCHVNQQAIPDSYLPR